MPFTDKAPVAQRGQAVCLQLHSRCEFRGGEELEYKLCRAGLTSWPCTFWGLEYNPLAPAPSSLTPGTLPQEASHGVNCGERNSSAELGVWHKKAPIININIPSPGQVQRVWAPSSSAQWEGLPSERA